MRIIAINPVQQNKTNKQNFGTLKSAVITDELKDLLQGDVISIRRLRKKLKKIKKIQRNNNVCDIDFFISRNVPAVLHGPSINLLARNSGVVIGQFNIKQEAYKGLSLVGSIIKMLDDASKAATKIQEI